MHTALSWWSQNRQNDPTILGLVSSPTQQVIYNKLQWIITSFPRPFQQKALQKATEPGSNWMARSSAGGEFDSLGLWNGNPKAIKIGGRWSWIQIHTMFNLVHFETMLCWWIVLVRFEHVCCWMKKLVKSVGEVAYHARNAGARRQKHRLLLQLVSHLHRDFQQHLRPRTFCSILILI